MSAEKMNDRALLAGNDDGVVEIDLTELFYTILQRWPFILLMIILFTGLAAAYTTQYVVPMYKATSKLYVMSSKDSAINLSDLQIGSYLTNDYQEVFKTWEVHEQVNKNLGLNYSYGTLEKMVRVSNPANTRILTITATSPNPDEAAALANEYARVAQKYISDTMKTDEPSILSDALKPLRPSTPILSRNLIIGFMLGLMISVGIVFLGFLADDRIKTADDVTKHIGVPTLAVVPIQKELREQYRRNKKKRRS